MTDEGRNVGRIAEISWIRRRLLSLLDSGNLTRLPAWVARDDDDGSKQANPGISLTRCTEIRGNEVLSERRQLFQSNPCFLP